jgi:hypothetical protein
MLVADNEVRHSPGVVVLRLSDGSYFVFVDSTFFLINGKYG